MTLAVTDCLKVIEPAALRRAMDPERVRAPLARFLGLEPDAISASVERTHFSGARSPVLHYRVSGGSAQSGALVLAELVGDRAESHAAAEIVHLSKSRRAQIRKGASDSLLGDSATGLVFRRPGLDAKLPGLRLLHDPVSAAEAVADALGVAARGLLVTTTLRAHRLGKRAVLQLDLQGARPARLFARLRATTSPSGSAAHARHQEIVAAMAGVPGIAVPRSLGYDAGLGVGLFEALPGDPPSFRPPEAKTSAQAIAAALQAILVHGPTGSPYAASDEIVMLRGWADTLRAVLPELALGAEKALGVVEPALLRLDPVSPRACHRDFHEGQILLQEGCAGVLDFDTYCLADPALDAGNMIAHLRMRALLGCRGASLAEREFRRCLPAYVGTERIGCWTRAALLRLGCIHAFTSRGRELASALMREAAN